MFWHNWPENSHYHGKCYIYRHRCESVKYMSYQEEANTLLIFHALHHAYMFSKLLIKSPSWHSSFIAMHKYPLLRPKVFHRLGAGNKRGDIYVEPIYIILSWWTPDWCPCFAGLYTNNWQDICIYSKCEMTCWKIIQKARPNVLAAFIEIENIVYPSKEADILVFKIVRVCLFVQLSCAAKCKETAFANVQEERICLWKAASNQRIALI